MGTFCAISFGNRVAHGIEVRTDLFRSLIMCERKTWHAQSGTSTVAVSAQRDAGERGVSDIDVSPLTVLRRFGASCFGRWQASL